MAARAKPLCAEVTVVNSRGLHARAAAKFVKLAESFDAAVIVAKDGMEVPGTSIMGLMMLGAGRHSVLELRVVGTQAPQAFAALVNLIESGFGED
jgi:phosphocarrier protein